LKKQRAPMQAEMLIPQDFSAGEAVETIRYEMVDYVGDTDDANQASDTTYTSDVAYGEALIGVRGGKVGYQYTTHEMRVAAFLRKPLPEAKMEAAIQTYKRRINNVGLFGDAKYGFTGLFNNAYVPTATFPTGGWTVSTDVDLMLADLNHLLYVAWKASKQNDIPDQLCLTELAYTLTQQRRIPNTNISVLDFFKEHNLLKSRTGKIISVDPIYSLDTSAPDGGDMAMAYCRDPMHVKQHIPMPLKFLAPQLDDTYVKIPGEYRYAPTHVRYVNSAAYGFNLTA
jgi:hypothetical protein